MKWFQRFFLFFYPFLVDANKGRLSDYHSQSRNPPDRKTVGRTHTLLVFLQGFNEEHAYNAKVPWWSHNDGNKRDDAYYDERNPFKQSEHEKRTHYWDEKGRMERELPRHDGRKSISEEITKQHQHISQTSEQSPDIHPRRKKNLHLSS